MMTTTMHATGGGVSSASAPRMEIFQSTWAMMDRPGATGPFGLNLESVVDWAAANGFAGVMHGVQAPADFAAFDVIRRAGLLPGAGFPVRDLHSAAAILEAGAASGAVFLNAQVHDAFMLEVDAVARLEVLYQMADRLGVPLFIETHRGTVTQDLIRTVRYLREIPRLVFTLDASHYVVAGEITAPFQAQRFNEFLSEIIARTASIHARVSNGEQVQVDVGDGSAPVAQPFIRWWTSAYQQWLLRAMPGEIFPFVSELGPRPYAIAAPTGEEMGDRLAQALVFKHIAEAIQTEVGIAA